MDVSVQSEAELQAELEQVNEALRAATTGSSYSIGGRTLTRQDIASLEARRTRIIRDLRTLKAVLNGASSPGEATATWYR